MQKVHWNDIEDLKLPEVERKVISNSNGFGEQIEHILYIVNDSIYSKEDFEKINPEAIESVNVIKDSLQITEYTSENFDGIIKVQLKSD